MVRLFPPSMNPSHNTNSTSSITISTIHQSTVLQQLVYPRSIIKKFSSASLTTETNMVAITSGQKQLTRASKDEFPKWKSNLRVLLNQLRVLDTECGDKVRAYLGNPILPENYGKPRGMVTVDLFESVDGPSLRAAGFQLGDTLITGSDRREWVKVKDVFSLST